MHAAVKEFKALQYPLRVLCCLKVVGLKTSRAQFWWNKSFLSGGTSVGITLNVCGLRLKCDLLE